MQFFLPKKSFTLIEMLIVIVIIGILAAALVPRLQSVQARARDTKRITDVHALQQSANMYILDRGKPALSNLGTNVSSQNCGTGSTGTSALYRGNWLILSDQLKPYINDILFKDSLGNRNFRPWCYWYNIGTNAQCPGTDTKFSIVFTLESINNAPYDKYIPSNQGGPGTTRYCAYDK